MAQRLFYGFLFTSCCLHQVYDATLAGLSYDVDVTVRGFRYNIPSRTHSLSFVPAPNLLSGTHSLITIGVITMN